ncbi:MAG: gliding motility-associated C-terminal domain-containing protein, partial [Saprospiraceae bacterium]|nr:gliding motility-associated C-terminal domain-containing protein [Saprospiraceae bacterium]
EAELQIDQAEPFRIESILVLPATCDAKNGELEIKMQGNQLDILYKLNGELQFESVFRNLSAGEYMLQITGGSSCSIDTAINITKARCSVFAPNAFSPDHDGFNDDFRLFTGDQTEVQINTYQIFDRWGNSIYRALNFPLQSQSKWWDGTFQGRPVANGTYLYQIEISDADNSKEVLQGTISVVR